MRARRTSHIVIYFTASTLILCVATLTWNRYRRKTQQEDDGSRLPNPETLTKLPSHLERDLRKARRLAKVIPMLAMKKPMYDNIIMKDPTGYILCTVSLKKAHWYIGKKLAKWEEENRCIRLMFEPKSNKTTSSTNDNEQTNAALYNKSFKQNVCVVCGKTKNYRRHYVVPYCYRSRFPDRFKTHLPHDIVILCPSCHIRAQNVAQNRRDRLEGRLRANLPAASSKPTLIDPHLVRVRSAASALLRHGKRLPHDRIVELTGIIREHLGESHSASVGRDLLTTATLREMAQMEPGNANPEYVSGPELVMKELDEKMRAMRGGSVGEVEEMVLGDFIRDWRRVFIESLRPRHLPTGWQVDAAVVSNTL